MDFALIRWRNNQVFKLVTKSKSKHFSHTILKVNIFTGQFSGLPYMESSRAVTEVFCSRMTNKCSILRNNIPIHVVRLSIMQLSRRHTDRLFNKGGMC